MMADERIMPEAETVAETEAVAEASATEASELDISEKLKNAAGNIRRAGAGARKSKSESEKSRKQSEAEAQARLEETEKKLKDDEERARLVAEQKMAALEYAQNYRKKLQKDRQKAMSAAKAREKAEREAEEAAAKEQRAKEIAELLEKERNEAKERGEKASELLNRVTKRAVVDENGKVRMVDKIDMLKEQEEAERAEAAKAAEAEKALAEARAKEAEARAKAAAEAARAAAISSEPAGTARMDAARLEVEKFLEGEMARVDGDSILLDIEDDVITVSLTDKDDPAIIPADMIGETSEEKLASALSEHEEVLRAIEENSKLAKEEMKRMLAEEQERFAKQTEALKAHSEELARLQEERRRDLLAEIAAIAAIATAGAVKAEPKEEPKAEAPEEPKEEPVSYAPIINNDPVVLSLRERGNRAVTKRQLKKYIRKSNKAAKKIEKKLAAYEEARRISDEARSRIALCYAMNECGKILEIRCDNLSAAARIRHDKLVKKLRLGLYSEIERFNRKATEFAVETGEPLTRVSAFLPDHLTNNTGKAVIPVLAYRDRYEQLTPDDPEMPKAYVVSFPSVATLKAGETTEAVSSVVAVGGEKKNNPITTKTLVEPALSESDLLGAKSEGVSKKSFKKLRKRAKKAYKALDKKSRKLGTVTAPAAAVADLLLSREAVLVGSRVLVDAVKLGNAKWVGKSRIKLEELFGLYNKKAGVCERICNTPVTKIHPLTASKVAEAMLIPDMPRMVHVNELFETVGDNTRIVGDPSGKKSSDPDGSFTFLIGGSKSTDLVSVSATLAATENSPAADKSGAFGGASAAKVNVGHFYSVKGMPYPPMCTGAYVGGAEGDGKADGSAVNSAEAAASVAEGAKSQTVTVAGVDTPVFHGSLSGKELADFRKKSDNGYKTAKMQLAEINAKRSSARGDERVELDVRALTVEKELIDSLADSVYVAGASSDKKLLKRSRCRLLEEIEAHNELVDDLGLISGVHLSRVPETLYEDIVSGNGYKRTPKIEYQVTEGAAVCCNSDIGAAEGSNAGKNNLAERFEIFEISGGADGGEPSGVEMSKADLKKYKAQSNKEYKCAEKKIAVIEKSAKGKSGSALNEAEIDKINAQREKIDGLCRDIAIARDAGDKAFAKSSAKKLGAEIKAHNQLVSEFEKSSGAKLTAIDEGMPKAILGGEGYSKAPRLEFKVNSTAKAHQINSGEASLPEIRMLNVRDGSLSSHTLSGKELKSFKKNGEKSYSALTREADGLAKSRKSAVGGERVDLDIKELEVRKLIIDSLCDTVSVAKSSGDDKLLKSAKSRLNSEIKAHNALVDDLGKIGGITLTKASENLYADVVSGGGYRRVPKISLEVAEYAPAQQVVYAETEGADGKANNGSKAKSGKAAGKNVAPVIVTAPEPLGKKQISRSIKQNGRTLELSEKQIDDLKTKNKVAVGVEKHKILVGLLNAQRTKTEAEASNLALLCASDASKGKIKKQKNRLNESVAEYNRLAAEYEDYTGDELTQADSKMAEKIIGGKPFSRIRQLELSVVSKGYEYSYADYVGHDNKINSGKDVAVAKSQAEAEKRNAINYEMASLGNAVKRQADKDNRTVAAAFMYSKGLVQCEYDSRNYSYGDGKSKSRVKVDDIVARCKKIDVNGKRALNAENEANKRYYEVVTTNPKSVAPVGKKRRWKAIPFFKEKYTNQDIVYLRDEIMRLLNERDRINGELISIYEGQVVDLGGKPLALDIRRVKANAAKKMYNSRSTKVWAKKVDKKVVDSYDRQVLYGYLNDQIEAESNIAVIDYRLKHAKADNLTPYEIDQLKYDRKAQQKAKARAESQFRRTYRSCSEDSDSGAVWLVGLGILILAVVGVAVGLAWFFGPNLLENLKTWFGIGG